MWNLRLLVISTIVISMFNFGCQKTGLNSDVYSDDDFRRNGDLDVIKSLESNGSDLTKPHEIEHHFIVQDKAQGESLAKWGRENGFTPSDVSKGEYQGEEYYYLDLVKPTIPTIDNISVDTKRLAAIAGERKIQYDGWGSYIVK